MFSSQMDRFIASVKSESLTRDKLLEWRHLYTLRVLTGHESSHSSADQALKTFNASLTLAVIRVVEGFVFASANWQQEADAARTATAHLDAAMAAFGENRGADLEAHLRQAVEAVSSTSARFGDASVDTRFMKMGADVAGDVLEDPESRSELDRWLQFESGRQIQIERDLKPIAPPAVASSEVEEMLPAPEMLPDWPPREEDDG